RSYDATVESSRAQHFQRFVRWKSCRCIALTSHSDAVPRRLARVWPLKDRCLTRLMVALVPLRLGVAARLEAVGCFLLRREASLGCSLPLQDVCIRSSQKSQRRQNPSGLGGIF